MKKIALLAATALAITSTMASAETASLRVERQAFLDLGLAGSSLLRDETATVSALGTASATCTLSWGSTGAAPSHSLAASVSAIGSSAVTVSGTTTLTADRTNPQGMAIGKAVYTGSFNTANGSLSPHSLSCPTAEPITVTIAEVRGPNIPAVTEQVREPTCVQAAKDGPPPRGVDHCPFVTVEITPEQPGPIITPASSTTYTPTYTLGAVSTTFTGGTLTLDGVSVAFSF